MRSRERYPGTLALSSRQFVSKEDKHTTEQRSASDHLRLSRHDTVERTIDV